MEFLILWLLFAFASAAVAGAKRPQRHRVVPARRAVRHLRPDRRRLHAEHQAAGVHDHPRRRHGEHDGSAPARQDDWRGLLLAIVVVFGAVAALSAIVHFFGG